MMVKNWTTLILGAVIFAMLNIGWVYVFTLSSIKFEYVFDPSALLTLVRDSGLTTLVILLIMGLMMALAILTARAFSSRLTKDETIIMVFVGAALPIAVCFSLFANTLVFSVIMLFYLLGCLFFIKASEKDERLLSKMSAEYNVSKKIMAVVAAGSLVASFLFVYAHPAETQEKFKDSLIKIQTVMNVSGMITKDDIRQMVLAGGTTLLSKDQIKEQLINQTAILTGATPEQVMADQALMDTINAKTDETYDYQQQQIDSTIDATYARLTSSSSELTSPILERMFENPPLKYLFDFLPILISIMVASMVSLFGAVWVSPLSALLGMFAPAGQEQPQKPDVEKLKGFVKK